MKQGVTTAKELLDAKVKVEYCVDSAIGAVMKKVDKVVTQVQETILKPVAIIDQVVTALLELFDGGKKKEGKLGFSKRNIK